MSDDRLYPNRPHVAVGAVVWSDDKILLIKRGTPPKKGQWSIPGGMQNVGETLSNAVAREVLEETHITISHIELLDALDMIQKSDDNVIERHYTLIDYTATAKDEHTLKAGSDAEGAEFVHWVEACAKVHWGETRRIIELSAKNRGFY